MAFDMEKIRAKLEGLKTGNTNNTPKEIQENTWRPKKPGDGPTQIRLIANPHNDDEPFNELYFHYNIGRPGFICPERSFGKPCPACEMRKQLFQSNKELDKQLAKKFFPKERYYAVVINREDDEPKPRYWQFGKGIYMSLLEKLVDPDYATFLDPKEGLDMVVEQTKQKDKDFADTSCTPRRKESVLADSDEEIEEIMDAVPALMDVFGAYKLSTKEILERVETFMNANKKEDKPADEEEDEEKPSKETVKGGKAKKSKKKSTDSVDAAFESLLNDDDVESDDDEDE
jgi:hypothetical protein